MENVNPWGNIFKGTKKFVRKVNIVNKVMPENVTEDVTHPTWESYAFNLTNDEVAYVITSVFCATQPTVV